jgi:hypothetical protein
MHLRSILLFALGGLAAAPAAAEDLVLDPASGYTISALVKGQPVRLRVDPGAPGYVILNPAAVTRLGLKGSLVRSSTRVGPVRLRGGSHGIRLAIGSSVVKGWAAWVGRDMVDGADGAISPELLPYDRVVFRLKAAGAGERVSKVQLGYGPSTGLVMSIGARPDRLDVRFTLLDRFTMATAAAGAILARTYGGSWSGAARDEVVKFGIVRPVRPMRLSQPLDLNGFRLARLLVRTSDFRGDYQLPADAADPDEVVVTGSTKSRQPARRVLTIGRDALGSCSELAYDKRVRLLTLLCPGAATGAGS